jgi:hypothetical protein
MAQEETVDLERKLEMLPRFDAIEIVDGLCEKLQDTEFEDYSSEDELLLEIGGMVTEYVDAELGELASVWVEGQDKGKIRSVWAYGADFWPDIAIEVRELPVIAIAVKLAKRGDSLADLVTSAIGNALIYSVQYSYGIVFVLDRTESDLRKHWFDGEIEARLWDNHRIRLVIRE